MPLLESAYISVVTIGWVVPGAAEVEFTGLRVVLGTVGAVSVVVDTLETTGVVLEYTGSVGTPVPVGPAAVVEFPETEYGTYGLVTGESGVDTGTAGVEVGTGRMLEGVPQAKPTL